MIPPRGAILKLDMSPQAGHEQAGWRPALVLSPSMYNRMGMAIIVPITSQVKGFSFEKELPEDLDVTGVVLMDQVRNVDYGARRAKIVGQAPKWFVDEVARISAGLILSEDD